MIDDEIKEILAESYADTRKFSKVFFPERFHAPFSQLHDQIYEAIDSGHNKIVIAAPRGIGKTSIAALALPAKNILFGDKHFIVYISNSATSAELQTENLKRELLVNQIVRKLFPPIKAKAASGVSETFSKSAWITSNDVMVYPRGSGQQIRGILHGNYRPDLIIVDDLEDTETIKNPDVRKARDEWFHGDVLKCVSRVEKNWAIIYIDTLKHEDALLQHLLDSEDWYSLKLELCDDNFNSLAPEFVSTEEIKAEADYYREQDMLDVFYREYRNMPISTEDATFRQEYFRYYNEPDIYNDKNIENLIIIEPAKTVKIHSAESAIIGVGIDRNSAKIYVRDIINRKMYPDEIYNEMFDMAARLHARVVGVEVTSLHEFITQPIRNEMIKRGVFFELVELKARAKKEERIAALVPFYRQGYVYHNLTACGPLEAQLLAFPRSRLMDVMDGLAYVIEMMELGDRYFEPTYDETDLEAEFMELEYEKPLENWRVA